MTNRRPIRAASTTGARGRGHATLAPAHLGEAAAAATVAVVVGGLALVITGIGMLALSLTLGSRYVSDPPPSLGSMILVQSIGAVVLTLFGVGLAAGGVAVLGDVPRSRLITGVLSGVAGVASAAGTILVATARPGSPVIAIALAIMTLVFGAAAILLLRRAR
ncbi:MAG: hypothetical protein IT341_01295 [Chloroflexi bacterium]|nr:hypothetical protein [Chloroflexota bacterium]